MDIYLNCAPGTTASVLVEKTEGWEIADVAALAVSQVTGVASVATAEDLMLAVNVARLMYGVKGVPQRLLDVLAQSQTQVGSTYVSISQSMSMSDLFSPDWWNDLFGGHSLKMFVSNGSGAVVLDVSSIATSAWTVTSKGVREGDSSKADYVALNGRLHRWGEGGHYTGFNTSAPPAIVEFNGQFHVYFRDGNGNGILHAVSDTGLLWKAAAPYYIGFNTSSAPCPVVGDDGVLRIFFRDGNGNGILHVVSNDGNNFSAPDNWYIGLNCDNQPSATLFNGNLCLVAGDAGGNGAMYAVWNSTNGWQTGYSGRNTSLRPAVIAFQNQLHMFYRDSGGSGIMHAVSNDGVSWSDANPSYIGFNTSAGPCPVIYNGQLLVLFRDGNGNGVLYVTSSDGVNFTAPQDWYLGLNCNNEPSATLAKDNELIVVGLDNSGNGIMCMVDDLSP